MKELRSRVQVPVIMYVKERPGQALHSSEVAEALKLNPGSVSSVFSRLVKIPESGIEAVPGTTGFFIYRPVQKTVQAPNPVEQPVGRERPSEVLYRRLGTLRTGALLLESEDGTLYRAEEL